MTTNHDADQLDRWLDSITGDSAKSPNGTTSAAPDALVSVARRYHASLHAAEQRAMPTIPARAIWEDVMRNTVPIDRIVASPIAGENGGQLPSATPPTAHGWEPAQTRHWFVPAALIAIAAIVIVAVYAAFFDSPETPPPTTGLPGIAFSTPDSSPISTPEPDIDRWLPDQSQVACASPEITLSQQSAIAQPSRPTDEPMNVDDYLPFSAASPTNQEMIAERALRIQSNCPPTAQDPLVSDDFSWMPGPSVALASPAQIETAQQISAALPDQNFLNHYIVRPPSDGVTFDAMGVLLPQDVVMLPDGRMGGPFRIVLETDTPLERIHKVTDGRDVATPVFVVFKQVDGLWLYDELFLLCIGDCNDYWAMVSGEMSWTGTPLPSTPAATPDLSQATVSCDVEPRSLEEISALQQAPPDVPDRQYGPTSPVNAETAQQIADASQLLDACRMAGEIHSMASPRLIYETRETGSFGGKLPITLEELDDFVAQQQELSALFPTGDVSDYVIESDQVPENNVVRLMLPENIVQLADGRVGGPVTSFYPSGRENSPFEYALVEVNFFAPDPTENGRWVIDEFLLMCVGECDAYYELLRSDLAATEPQSIPVATPAADESWLEPITAAECTVEGLSNDEVSAIVRDAGDERETSYVPVGPADPEMVRQAAEADRAWQACSWFGSIGQRTVFQTDQLTSQGPENPEQATDLTRGGSRETIIARFDDRRALGEAISTGDWQDYVRVSEDAVTDVYDPAQFSAITTLPWPDGAVELADGRIAIPLVRLVSPEDWEFSREAIEEGRHSYITGDVHILALDPETNAWVVDEAISLCLINCDVARTQLVEYLDTVAELLGTPAATPAADPKSTPTAPAQPASTPAAVHGVTSGAIAKEGHTRFGSPFQPSRSESLTLPYHVAHR